ncbi:hypothetical protein [Sphingomonas sp.]|uniref:hypothetical protein n=1 Tax=Sphingomonas sp. TaxID=28214 RepID=UPI0028A62C43|nr:hypothetical protein [Sphingomonas sp.]
MKLVRPLSISLAASSVPEADYPAWDAGTTYALGARVIVAALHRVFESVAGGNVGHAPALGGNSFWLDAGPTNRWAMFDRAAGPATRSAAPIAVTLALPDAVDAIGLVDLQAASVRVQVTAGGEILLDTTRAAPAACEVFLALPASTARSAIITIAPTGGAAVIGKLITGAALELGTLADAPTVGLTDFSRRETDQFGITTIAERDWTKRIEAKCRIDDAAVDGIQRQLAAVRATAALWIGEGDFPSLIAYGIFRDFSQVISLQGISTCSLTIEGYPAADIAVPAADPALNGASDFQVVRPAAVTDAVLISSSVLENDYPIYSPDRTYIAGERVLVPSAHRAYESAAGGNKGNPPGADSTHWIDAGPSKRWAMFDQALGTATTASGAITVQLRPGTAINALALLDIAAASVRVQAAGYDQTQAIAPGVTAALFLDLTVPAGSDITVTVAASAGAAAVGTLIIGAREGLGLLADAPASTLLDFSTKQTDDFGLTVPIERAWAKKMEAQSQIATARADGLMRRLATLRAVPALWIGATEFEALTIYGFFRDFTLTLGETVSTTSVTIEGLAKASPDAPSNTVVTWDSIVGPGKPQDNATVGAPAGTNVGGVPAQDIADAVKDGSGAVVPTRDQVAAVKAQIDGAVSSAQADASHARDDAAAARADLAIEVQRAKGAEGAINTTLAAVKSTADGASAAVTDEATVRARDDIALSNRTSTTEAQLAGTQGSVLAGRITDEATARANADNAIASRTSTTEAQLAGTQESALKARIVSEETARAGQDAALANRATSLEAAAIASAVGAALNPNFARWADGDYTPTGWLSWGMEGTARFARVNGGGVRGSPYAIDMRNDTAETEWGFVQDAAMSPGMWVIEAAISLDQGDLYGAGVTLSGVQGIDFSVEADTNGAVGSLYGLRTFSKMVDWQQGGIVHLHGMGGWSGYGRYRAQKYMRWFYLNVRPATDGEIKAGKALIDAGSALARITTEETTRANQDTALANRISTTEAQLAGSLGSQLQARIAAEETARANQDVAIANRTTTVEAQLSGTQASPLGSRVITTESAIATLNNRASAYWQVLAVAGNNRAQVTVRADANGGAGIDLVGDVSFKGSLDVGADSGGNRVKITNNGLTFYDANGTYRGGIGLKA